MSTSELIRKMADMLDETKWGQDFTRDEVERLAGYMRVKHFLRGEQIFEQGERESYMAFIVKGTIEVLKESADTLETIVVTLHPRTHFGEMSFVDEEPRSATAVAKDDVTLLVLPKERFDAIIREDKDMAIKMLMKIAKTISRRLRTTTGKLVYTRT